MAHLNYLTSAVQAAKVLSPKSPCKIAIVMIFIPIYYLETLKNDKALEASHTKSFTNSTLLIIIYKLSGLDIY